MASISRRCLERESKIEPVPSLKTSVNRAMDASVAARWKACALTSHKRISTSPGWSFLRIKRPVVSSTHRWRASIVWRSRRVAF